MEEKQTNEPTLSNEQTQHALTIWSEKGIDGLQEYLSQHYHLPDYRTNVRQSVQIDVLVYGFELSKSKAFSSNQTSAFLQIVNSVRDKIINGNEKYLEEIMEYLKQTFAEYSKSSTMQVAKEVVPPPVEDKKPGTAKKGAKEERIEPVIEYETVTVPPLFGVDDVREMTNFLLQNLIQHALIYRYVFKFDQQRDLYQYSEIFQVVYPPLPLASAVEDTQWKEKKEQERLEREAQERKRIEAEESKKREEEEAKRKQEEEERILKQEPTLTDDDLEQVANYLKYYITKTIHTKKEELNQKLAEVESKMK